MEIDLDDIDIERLRSDLSDYFTSAMFIASPVALIDLTRVENASDEELIRIAIANNFNILDYVNEYER